MPITGTVFSSHNSSTKKNFAFTLSEVLITLGIIGVVAAITIPGLIMMHRKHEVEAKIQENYSKISQVMKSVIYDNDVDDISGIQDIFITTYGSRQWINSSALIDQMYNHIKIANYYDNSDVGKNKPIRMCLGDNERPRKYADDAVYIDLKGGAVTTHFNPIGQNGNMNYKYDAIELLDGTCWQINPNQYDGTDSITWSDAIDGFEVAVDINGTLKGPNVLGIDLFYYLVSLDGNAHFYGYQYSNEEIDKRNTRGVCDLNGIYAPGKLCGEKIRRNGWKIWSRYPWKFKTK